MSMLPSPEGRGEFKLPLTVDAYAYASISTSFWCVTPMLRVPKKPKFLGPSLCWIASNSCNRASTASDLETSGQLAVGVRLAY